MDKKIAPRFLQLLLKLIVILIFNSPVYSFGQNKIVLGPNELPGFELKGESKWGWSVGDNVYDAIHQFWLVSDTNVVQELIILYGEFPTLPITIFSASDHAYSHVGGYNWGSPTLHIIGEETWFAQYSPDSPNTGAIYFTKANIAVQIVTGSISKRDFNKLFETISSKIIDKINISFTSFINSEISDSVIHTHEESTQFIDTLIPKVKSQVEKLSVWIIDSTNYCFGVRNEYLNDSITIGVDLCELDTETEATNAAMIKAENCSMSRKVFYMNDPNLPEKFQSEWDYYLNSILAEKTFSFILTGGRTVVHLYGFNMGPDNFVQMNLLVNEITLAVQKNNWIGETLRKENILEQNQPNPFSQSTMIKCNLPEGNKNSSIYLYNMQGLEQRIYPIPHNGRSQIVIDSFKLQAGIYFYTLMVDGKPVDTKRMILLN